MTDNKMDHTADDKKLAAKTPYATPRLVVYGDLRMITANRNHSGADGAGGASHFSL